MSPSRKNELFFRLVPNAVGSGVRHFSKMADSAGCSRYYEAIFLDRFDGVLGASGISPSSKKLRSSASAVFS